MTNNREKGQYLLVHTQFVNLFQDMYEHLSDFIGEWNMSVPDIFRSEGIDFESKADLIALDGQVEAMQEIITLFNEAAKEDMIEKTIRQTNVVGEA